MTKEELKEKLKGAMYAQRTLEGELDKLQELRNLAQKVSLLIANRLAAVVAMPKSWKIP